MRIKLLGIFITFVSLLLISNVVTATPILNDDGTDGFEDIGGSPYSTYVNSGTLLGTSAGNNIGSSTFIAAVEALVEEALGSTTDQQKADFVFTAAADSSISLASVDGGKSGTWSVVPATSTISFYAVKADNAYAIYQLLPDPASSGSWSTFDLLSYHPSDSLGISHFTVYNLLTGIPQVGTPPVNPVAEPATMLLFGTGLVGLAGVARRKKK